MTDTLPTQPSMVPSSAALRSHIARLADELRECKTLLKTVERIEARRNLPLPLFPEPAACLSPTAAPGATRPADAGPTWGLTGDQCPGCKAIATVHGNASGDRRCLHCANSWRAGHPTTPADAKTEGHP